MKYINVRQLLHTFNEATSELPVIVTKSGLPIFKIVPLHFVGDNKDMIEMEDGAEKISKKIAEETFEDVQSLRTDGLGSCNFPRCWNSAVGKGKDGLFYCKEHLNGK